MTATRAITTPCPVDGCGRRISVRLLMCGPHWREVPKAEQAAVYRTWRAYRSAPTDEAYAAYAAARAAALFTIGTIE